MVISTKNFILAVLNTCINSLSFKCSWKYVINRFVKRH